MNSYNLIGYSIYLIVTGFIILRVGKICYNNGTVFVENLIPGHHDLCIQINKILLVGYYLTNLGYAATTLISWTKIESLVVLITTVSSKIAFIILALAILHYINIYILTNYIQKLIK